MTLTEFISNNLTELLITVAGAGYAAWQVYLRRFAVNVVKNELENATTRLQVTALEEKVKATDQLKAQLEKLTADFLALKTTVEEYATANSALRKIVNDQSREMTALTLKVTDLEAEVKRLMAENERLQMEATEKKKAADSLEISLAIEKAKTETYERVITAVHIHIKAIEMNGKETPEVIPA